MHRGGAIVVWLMSGAAALASGCWLESHAPLEPVPLALFCDAFFDAMCEPLEDCGCAEGALWRCRTDQRDLCAGFPGAAMSAAVEEGRLRYDGAAAVELITRTRSRAETCGSFVDAIDWRVRDLFTIGRVFEGTVPAGQPCSVLGFELISECAFGSCAPVGGLHVCRGVVGAGERCDATHQCADLDARLTIDIGIDRLVLLCVSASGDDVGTCERRVADAGACGNDLECESGLCAEGRCRSRVEGEPCASSRECASGYCSVDERRCAAGDAPDGASCGDPAACASHVCIGAACLPAGCGTF